MARRRRPPSPLADLAVQRRETGQSKLPSLLLCCIGKGKWTKGLAGHAEGLILEVRKRNTSDTNIYRIVLKIVLRIPKSWAGLPPSPDHPNPSLCPLPPFPMCLLWFFWGWWELWVFGVGRRKGETRKGMLRVLISAAGRSPLVGRPVGKQSRPRSPPPPSCAHIPIFKHVFSPPPPIHS